MQRSLEDVSSRLRVLEQDKAMLEAGAARLQQQVTLEVVCRLPVGNGTAYLQKVGCGWLRPIA